MPPPRGGSWCVVPRARQSGWGHCRRDQRRCCAAAAAALRRTQDHARAGNLAFLGDALWSLYVRNHFLTPPKHVSKYHQAVGRHVTAEAQAAYYDALLASGKLSSSEAELMRSVAGGSSPPGASGGSKASGAGAGKQQQQQQQPQQFRKRFASPAHQRVYMKATALEALVGQLHLTDGDRLEEVMGLCLALVDGRETGSVSSGVCY
ncbi:hypothetical protein FOA52_014344 [Chlamydomonas sp. UWO 241]|nr:hypothetical protein FOA52_014344 [Chlamydomonas sp. UWO 241]